MLRLLSAGAAGAILLTLDEGAMQSKVLTQRVRGYTARTIYRYLPRLARLGAVERDDRPGGAARVVHTLSQRGGNELCDLINRFATASMTHLPGGQVEPEAWASLGLLADLWEAGVVEELSQGPQSLAELARRLEALSYHQLNRRASRFKASGFFGETGQTERRGYVLTDKARRTMGLIAGLGRWRRRHLAGEGLTVEEMTTVLRISLPLAEVPSRAGKTMQVTVRGGVGETARELWAEIGGDGALHVKDDHASQSSDCWAEGSVDNWMAALVDGKPPAKSGGDVEMVAACLTSLYEKLWTPSPF